MFLYAGKDRPELYFDEGFRNGISAFREFASAEVAHGLAGLRADLDSGRWRAIRPVLLKAGATTASLSPNVRGKDDQQLNRPLTCD